MSLIKRSTKGSPLSAPDHDGNIDHIARLGFPDLAALLADTTTGWSIGEIIRAGQYDYRVVSTGEHITTAGGIKLVAVPGPSGYALTQIGTSVAQMTTLLTTADAEGVGVWHFGALTLNDTLFLRERGLRGAGGMRNDTNAITCNVPLRIGREGTVAGEAGSRISNYSPMRDLGLIGGDSSVPTVEQAEAHWQLIDNVSFRGTKNAGVPHLWLGATLYNRVMNCDFGGTGSDGIRGVESDFDITYYGVNASWFTQNAFFLPGTAAHLHGVFSFRDSTIEASDSVKSKLILGESGGSVAGSCVVDNIYFEGNVSAAEGQDAFGIIEVRSEQYAKISNCQLQFSISGSHEDIANFAGIKSTANQTYLSVRGTQFDIGSTADLTAISHSAQSHSYTELVGNYWSTSRDYKITVSGDDMRTKSTQASTIPLRRVYIRDRMHGEVKMNIPERNIWLTYNATQNQIRVDGGKHHVITATPTGDLTCSDTTRWRGARFTIHFDAAGCVLKHGEGYFYLAKGSDAAIPQGTVLDFVVDRNGAVREVGNASVGFAAP